MSAPPDVTQLLAELADGDERAIDRLLPLVYEELHRMAHVQRLYERDGHTLNTTGLVHEAYLKLVKLDRMQWKSRAHFLAVAAQAMRRVLVNYAVHRKAQKRGGGAVKVPLDEVQIMSEQQADDMLALDNALQGLAELNKRQHQVVECRFFGGMSIEETAAVLDISPATVKRDWNVARAWLNRELKNEA